MTWWQRVRRRWRLEDELDAELRFHFDRLVADYMRDGCSERDARQRARAEFGGLEAVKDDCRDARGTGWVHDIAHDLRFAARLLAKDRGFTAIAVLALALGMGVNNTLFTVAEAICLRGLPIADADRVVEISERDQTHPFLTLSRRQFETLAAAIPPEIRELSAYVSRPSTLRDDTLPAERVIVAYVSSGALDAIGQKPFVGRAFRRDEDRVGRAAVAVLSAAVWRARYGADPGIVGRLIRLNGAPVSVIGVMPDGFRFPDNADVWQPLAAIAIYPDARALRVFARLALGTTVAQASDAVAAVMTRLPGTDAASSARPLVLPINERYRSDITNPAWIAFITVGLLVVIIACSNVANLLLARGVQRAREMAIRLSLGATRVRIVRQLLIESALLALVGGIAAVGVSAGGLRLLSIIMPPNVLPYWVTLTMDARIAAVLAAVCLGTVLLFGLAPALQIARTQPAAVTRRAISGASQDRGTARWTWGFLTCQLALTVVLLSKVGMTVQTYYALEAREPAIDAARVLTFGISLPRDAYKEPDRGSAFYDALTERLVATRRADSISIATALPSDVGVLRQIRPDGQGRANASPPVRMHTIDGKYFHTLGLSLVEGRAFAARGTMDDRTAIIVNQRFAELYFAGRPAVGQRVRLEMPDDVRMIVGVAPSIRRMPTIEAEPLAYLPLTAETMVNTVVLVRTHDDAAALAPIVREEVRALDADLPVTRLMTLERATWLARSVGRLSTQIVTSVAFIALALATIGLAGLTAYGVAQRGRELGIRLALGATRRRIVLLVLRRVAAQIAVGLVFGIFATFAWDRAFGEASIAPSLTVLNLAGVSLFVTAIALAVSALPAARAGGIDPLIILRQD
jgi:predicted permease